MTTVVAETSEYGFDGGWLARAIVPSKIVPRVTTYATDRDDTDVTVGFGIVTTLTQSHLGLENPGVLVRTGVSVLVSDATYGFQSPSVSVEAILATIVRPTSNQFVRTSDDVTVRIPCKATTSDAKSFAFCSTGPDPTLLAKRKARHYRRKLQPEAVPEGAVVIQVL